MNLCCLVKILGRMISVYDGGFPYYIDTQTVTQAIFEAQQG